ncbi:MAG: hypothetical protein JRS35_08715 [Deltaproteobacteria bacterium]|nr:hypothetical protein [Deltaproteobacteria bacterium]
MKIERIPHRYFLYWSGDAFQYVNYLCVLSLVRTNAVEGVTVYYENIPRHRRYWDLLSLLSQVELILLDWNHLAQSCGVDERAIQRLLSVSAVNHRSDMFRYFVIYSQGGVYLDFDCLVVKDLSPLLRAGFFLGLQPEGEPINGAVLGGSREGRILGVLIENLFRAVAGKEQLHWTAFGPTLLTHVVAGESLLFKGFLKLIQRDEPNLRSRGRRLLARLLHRLQDSRLKIYPPEYFYPFSFEEWKRIFECSALARNCYVIHLWGRMSNQYTRSIDADYVRTQNSLYANEARRITDSEGMFPL